MGLWFLGVFVVLEIASVVFLASVIKFWVTLLLLVAFAVFGVFLVRRAQAMMMQVMTRPNACTIHRVQAFLFAGILFLIPGFFSDFIGLILLLTPKNFLFDKVSEFSVMRTATAHFSMEEPDIEGVFIEGEIVEEGNKERR